MKKINITYYYSIMAKYVILLEDGQVLDYVENEDQLKRWMQYLEENKRKCSIIDLDKPHSHLRVEYAEMGGPHGYGHQETSFETYGSLLGVIRNFYKWVQKECTFWGPDPRDVEDYFRHCSLCINDEDRTKWLLSQVDKINRKTLYV